MRWIILSAVLCGCAIAQSADPPVLEIDGAKFTIADLETRKPSLFFDVRQKLFEGERAALESFIGDYLLERQAEKEGLTVAALLEKHVDQAIAKDPSEESLRVYYEGVDTTQPFEAVRDQILQAIRERRKARAKKAYLEQLRANAKVTTHLAPPRLQLSLNGTPVRGTREAAVMVVEYADFECPYCQQVEPVLERLQKEYAGKVAMAYKDAPLSMHSHAQKAAEAAQCAGDQGKYWEFHDLLYSSKKLDTPDLEEHAKSLKLDAARFEQCLSSGAHSAGVKASVTEFTGNGLEGTPSFFVNGRMVSGILTYEQFRDLVEEELAKGK